MSGAPSARPCWTALHYELPADDPPTRAYLWRQMRARRAVNLQRGLWAVPLEPGQSLPLEPVINRLRQSGATVAVHPVGVATADDDELHARLAVACERLWSPFVAAADRLASRLSGQVTSESAAAEIRRELAGLHDRFAATLVLDIASSPGADRAADRLDELEWIDANIRRPGDAPAAGHRARFTVISSVSLHDGRVRAVARLSPPPAPAWELALSEFEAAVYRDRSTHVAVRHGSVAVTDTLDGIARSLAHIEERLARFTMTFS